MTTFARWTTDAAGDLSRTWCWQPCDAANAWLPGGPLAADALAEHVARIADDDRGAARELAELAESLEWTGENWATRMDGIPGFEIEDELRDDEIHALVPATANVSASADAQLVLFAGAYVGEEYEAVISSARACRFQPAGIIRVVA